MDKTNNITKVKKSELMSERLKFECLETNNIWTLKWGQTGYGQFAAYRLWFPPDVSVKNPVRHNQ